MQYGKVIEEDGKIDESQTPLMADVEAQPITAQPIPDQPTIIYVNQPGYGPPPPGYGPPRPGFGPPPGPYGRHPPPGAYGTYGRPPPGGPPGPGGPGEPGEECAFIGCLFSWIPIVGIITYIINWSAMPHTRRAHWARIALFISLLVLIINIILWPSM